MDRRRRAISGNVFFAVFAAVAMVGAVGYGFNTVLRGPIAGMTDVTRRTVAESTVITSSRLAIVGATTYQTGGGDCDADGMIEPLPFAPATGPAPTGGGWLPRGAGPPAWTLVPNSLDPWKTEYGYCAWDPGSVQAAPGCGTGRLVGSPNKNVQAFVIISAGKNKKFETTCAAYNAATPNAALYNKPAGSDDIVLPYTYAEANDLGNGLWIPDAVTPSTKTGTSKNLEVKGVGQSSFSDVVQLTGSGGLVLPGDPGDDSVTGPCDAVNNHQLRRNTLDPLSPVIEVCDFTGGLGWSPISGTGGGGAGGGGGSGGGGSGYKVAHWKFDENTGTTAFDSMGPNNGTLFNSPSWSPYGGQIGGAISLTGGTNQVVRVPRTPYLEPSAISISLWLYRDGAQPDWATILKKTYQNNSGPTYVSWSINTDWSTDDLLVFSTGSTTGIHTAYVNGYLTHSGNYRVPNHQWVHLVVVYDPSAPADNKKIYLDGAYTGAITLTDPIAYDTTNTGDLYIGNSEFGTNAWNGKIDDVRVFNYALSDDEVREIHSAGATRLNTPSELNAGPMVGWGVDAHGKLGNGPDVTNDQLVPHLVGREGDNNWIQVAGGDHVVCGVKADGTAWCWGEDNQGKLGNGPDLTADQDLPSQVLDITNAIKVSASKDNSCVLTKDGRIFCSGYNQGGQLGAKSTVANSETPLQVAKYTDFIDVAVGHYSSCGLRANGTAYCWGSQFLGTGYSGWTVNEPVLVATVTDFVNISSSADNNGNAFCGVARSGRGYCWGTENNGNLGNGSATGEQVAPSLVQLPVGDDKHDWKKIVISRTSACGIRSGGTVWCWGADDRGQIGNGSATTGDQNLPQKVPGLSDIVDIVKQEYGACALNKDGYAWCWGEGDFGELGDSRGVDSDVPVLVRGGPFSAIGGASQGAFGILKTSPLSTTAQLPKGEHKISAGYSNCLIDPEGVAWCWGPNGNGQLGIGADYANKSRPARVTDAGPWAKISTNEDSNGEAHTCAIKSNGNLYCWGSNNDNKLGIAGGAQPSPALVGLTTDMWSQISVGANSSCGIKSDGKLFCWGQNDEGQLTAGSKTTPTEIRSGGQWSKVSVNKTTCAIALSGALYCWGSDDYGALGNGGTSLDVSEPSLVASPGPWIDVSANQGYVCGVKSNGTAWCWGRLSVLQPGLEDSEIPVPISDPGPWTLVDVSRDGHACGLKNDGSIWCWGLGPNGQLGDGVTTSSRKPVKVRGGDGWIGVSVANNLSCGLKANGSAWCWASDTYGRLGDGDILTATQAVPSRVDLYPKKPAWSWNNDNASFSPPLGVTPVIGSTRYISNDGSANTGLQLGASGASKITYPVGTTPNQLMVEAVGPAGLAQVSLKAPGALTTEDLIPGLVSRWKFDETSGTSAVDDISGNNATLFNGASWTTSGRINGAINFANSGNQYARVSRTSALEPSAVTLAFWLRATGTDGDGTIVSKSHTNNSGGYYVTYDVHFNSNRTLSFYTNAASAGFAEALNSPAVPYNTWRFVVVTYDPSAPAPQKNIYYDGVAVASQTRTVPLIYDTTSSGNLFIGKHRDAGSNERYYGRLDDLRIYNRALSASEVSQLYTNYTTAGTSMARMFGLDYASGSFKFQRSTSATDIWLDSSVPADLEIDYNGNVGMGTRGKPMAKLDVNGAVLISTNSGSCGTSQAGTIEYTGTNWRYCSSSGWKTFGGFSGTDSLWSVGDRQLECSEWGCCGIKVDGYMYCWGGTYDGRLGTNNNVTPALAPVKVHDAASAAGYNDWLAATDRGGIRAGGQAWAWGDNVDGQLGNSSQVDRYRPVLVYKNSGYPTPSAGWNDWVMMNISSTFAGCGIRTDGTAWCWGWAHDGETGTNVAGNGEFYTQPVQVHSSSSSTGWTDWRYIRTGGDKSCGIRANGSAWCWGYNGYGETGDGTATRRTRPVQVRDSAGTGYWTDWAKIYPGVGKQTCGIRTNGTGWCWGNGSDGQLGTNYVTHTPPGGAPGYSYLPVQVGSNCGTIYSDWIMIKPGAANLYESTHVCGVRSNGTLWCWGRGDNHQLGNGTATRQVCPTQVRDSAGTGYWTDWVNVEAGASFTCGQRANGTTWCWGLNTSDGHLGNGTTANSNYPALVQ